MSEQTPAQRIAEIEERVELERYEDGCHPLPDMRWLVDRCRKLEQALYDLVCPESVIEPYRKPPRWIPCGKCDICYAKKEDGYEY